MANIVAIDPGARDTGIIIINHDGTCTGYTVHNNGELLPPPTDYITNVLTTIDQHITNDTTIKVESLNRPNWHMAKTASRGAATNPTAIIGTAIILGAVLAQHPNAVLVPPGKNGSKPLGAYPPALVSDAEKRKPGWQTRVGTGKLRHQRSAYDIARYATHTQHATITTEKETKTIKATTCNRTTHPSRTTQPNYKTT